MPEPAPAWHLENFLECLDRWVDQEDAGQDVRLVVTAWIMNRFDDPYQGVRREPGFDNLWFGAIPRTLGEEGRVVVCSYWIMEATRTVRCDSIASLSPPV